MTYDEQLASRVRVLLGDSGDVVEKPMFAGLSFMVGGQLAVAVSGGGGLLVRLLPGELEPLLQLDHVGPMIMGSRTSTTWAHVRPEGLGTEADLREWVGRGTAAAGGASLRGTARTAPARPAAR